jgi:hypothetical protein
MTNPAFEGDAQGDEASESSTDATSSTSDDATSSTDDPTSSTSSTSDDATSSTDDPSETGTLPDLPDEACMGALGSPFTGVYGVAGQFGGMCPPGTMTTMKIVGPGPLPGLLIGSLCDDACSGGCDGTQYVFGVTGLAELSDPLLEQAAQIKTCVHVESLGSLGADANSRCLFSSMWIAEAATDDDRVLVGAAGPLPPSGVLLLEGKAPPSFGQQQFSCPCEQLGLADNELQCCLEPGVDPLFASLAFLDADLLPGEAADVVLDAATFGYRVSQAHQIGSCANEDLLPTSSWLLVRKAP